MSMNPQLPTPTEQDLGQALRVIQRYIQDQYEQRQNSVNAEQLQVPAEGVSQNDLGVVYLTACSMLQYVASNFRTNERNGRHLMTIQGILAALEDIGESVGILEGPRIFTPLEVLDVENDLDDKKKKMQGQSVEKPDAERTTTTDTQQTEISTGERQNMERNSVPGDSTQSGNEITAAVTSPYTESSESSTDLSSLSSPTAGSLVDSPDASPHRTSPCDTVAHQGDAPVAAVVSPKKQISPAASQQRLSSLDYQFPDAHEVKEVDNAATTTPRTFSSLNKTSPSATPNPPHLAASPAIGTLRSSSQFDYSSPGVHVDHDDGVRNSKTGLDEDGIASPGQKDTTIAHVAPQVPHASPTSKPDSATVTAPPATSSGNQVVPPNTEKFIKRVAAKNATRFIANIASDEMEEKDDRPPSIPYRRRQKQNMKAVVPVEEKQDNQETDEGKDDEQKLRQLPGTGTDIESDEEEDEMGTSSSSDVVLPKKYQQGEPGNSRALIEKRRREKKLLILSLMDARPVTKTYEQAVEYYNSCSLYQDDDEILKNLKLDLFKPSPENKEMPQIVTMTILAAKNLFLAHYDNQHGSSGKHEWSKMTADDQAVWVHRATAVHEQSLHEIKAGLIWFEEEVCQGVVKMRNATIARNEKRKEKRRAQKQKKSMEGGLEEGENEEELEDGVEEDEMSEEPAKKRIKLNHN